MAQITVEITQWLRTPTSSEHPPVLYRQDPCSVFNLKFYSQFKKKKKQKTKKLFLHFKCRPLGTQPQAQPQGPQPLQRSK